MLEENKGWKAPSTSAGSAATKAPVSCCCGSLGCGRDTVLWPMPSRGVQASEGTQGWMRGWPQAPGSHSITLRHRSRPMFCIAPLTCCYCHLQYHAGM